MEDFIQCPVCLEICTIPCLILHETDDTKSKSKAPACRQRLCEECFLELPTPKKCPMCNCSAYNYLVCMDLLMELDEKHTNMHCKYCDWIGTRLTYYHTHMLTHKKNKE